MKQHDNSRIDIREVWLHLYRTSDGLLFRDHPSINRASRSLLSKYFSRNSSNAEGVAGSCLVQWLTEHHYVDSAVDGGAVAQKLLDLKLIRSMQEDSTFSLNKEYFLGDHNNRFPDIPLRIENLVSPESGPEWTQTIESEYDEVARFKDHLKFITESPNSIKLHVDPSKHKIYSVPDKSASFELTSPVNVTVPYQNIFSRIILDLVEQKGLLMWLPILKSITCAVCEDIIKGKISTAVPLHIKLMEGGKPNECSFFRSTIAFTGNVAHKSMKTDFTRPSISLSKQLKMEKVEPTGYSVDSLNNHLQLVSYCPVDDLNADVVITDRLVHSDQRDRLIKNKKCTLIFCQKQQNIRRLSCALGEGHSRSTCDHLFIYKGTKSIVVLEGTPNRACDFVILRGANV
ncbi:hypothetical protein ACOME3_008509 [Neoechinorhynchus agilis]